MRRYLLRYHRLLGLGLGLILILWIAAGCLLVWQKPLERPKLSRPTLGQYAPLSAVMEAAWRLYPRQSGSWRLRFPTKVKEPVWVRYVADDPFTGPLEPVSIWIDPWRAQVLRVVEGRGEFFAGLYRFHSTLGFKGRLAPTGMGLLLGFFLGTGWALAYRRRQKRKGLHAWLGLAVTPPLLVSLVSGLTLLLSPQWISSVEDRIRPGAKVSPMIREIKTVDELVLEVQRCFPKAKLRELVIPGDEARPWELALYVPGQPDVEPAWVRLWIDRQHRQMTLWNPLANWRGCLRQWLYVLHTGELADVEGRIFLTFGALGLMAQAMLGWRLWYRRQRRRHGLATAQNLA